MFSVTKGEQRRKAAQGYVLDIICQWLGGLLRQRIKVNGQIYISEISCIFQNIYTP